MKEYSNYSLLGHNTFGIDVRAKMFVEFESKQELRAWLSSRTENANGPLLVIGRGSNLLFTDNYEGVVLHSCIDGIECVSDDENSVILRVGAGVVWDDFVEYCVRHEWYGVENLSLIPGEVGAAAVQNIGAYGLEAQNVIEEVETIDIATGAERTFAKSECQYAYRKSIFKNELKGQYVVTGVVFRLQKTFVPLVKYGALQQLFEDVDTAPITARQMRDAIIQIRKKKLPNPEDVGNAGSFFMNPVVDAMKFETIREKYPQVPFYNVGENYKIPAGWLIEQTGWKGRNLGAAGVYEKQALILVNRGGAKGRDIICLKDAICRDVQKQFGIELHPEVQFV